MKCHRCDGFMVEEIFMDVLDFNEFVIRAFRCINCGEVIDETTVNNRVKQYVENRDKLVGV